MSDVVTYAVEGKVATITMDDGKANALTFELFDALHAALDQAEASELAVVLAGREGRFSGGFHLPTLTTSGEDSPNLLKAGFEMSYRLLSYPFPVVIACTGHAYAMGSFLVLSGDYRIGQAGADHRITANEVAIGMVMPRTAVEICRQRLRRSAFERAVILAEVFSPEQALDAGHLDALVAGDVVAAAQAKAAELMDGLNLKAHAGTKLRAREGTLAAMRQAIEDDDTELRNALGLPPRT